MELIDLHAMERKAISNINNYNLINKGDLIVVGFSGGCDSTALLNILMKISKFFDFKLLAIHVNHMVRKDEAMRDEKFCIDFCSKSNININTIKVNIPQLSKISGKSAEEVGREERYRIFNEAGLKYSNSSHTYKIAVAHNRDDLTETVILNLIRGTSIDGLKGINYKRDNIIRPLLNISRYDLEKYCFDNNIEYVDDSTNIETIYKRNKIRHNVLPAISMVTEGNLSEKIYNMSRLIVDDIDFLTISAQNEYMKCLLKDENNKISLDLKYFNTLHKAIRRRIVRVLIKNIFGNVHGIESTHINDIVDLAFNNKTGKYLCLPSMIRVKTEYDILTAWIDNNQSLKKHKDRSFSIKINIPGVTELNLNKNNNEEDTKKINIKTKLTNLKSEGNILSPRNICCYTQKFDYDLTGDDLLLRNRLEGDIITPYKFNGTKKLKKYFIDEKMPLKMRNKIPLVAIGNEIIWVFGKMINQRYICTTNTKNIIEIEIYIFD